MELRFWLVHGNMKNNVDTMRIKSADLKNKFLLWGFYSFPCFLDVGKGADGHMMVRMIGEIKVSRERFRFSGFVQVLENLESHGILFQHFPGLESLGKRLLVLERSGNLFTNSSKKNRNVWQTLRRIKMEIMGEKRVNVNFMSPGKINLSSGKFREKSWKFVS